MESAAHFHIVDYIVFSGSLLISLVIGVYFAIKDRNEKSTDVYFRGKGEMSPWSLGLSLAVSFVSALTIMGYPVEVYLYGTVWFWVVICFPLVVLTTSHYFIPVYYSLKLKCVYEYLELRFNKTVRLLCSFFALMNLLLYMSVVVYYPALSLTTVTPISVNLAIAITVLVCTVYTVIGGFKSVIWTDVLQAFIMIAGCLSLLILLMFEVGGVSEVTAAINRGNRSTIFDFSMNPFQRSSVWSIFLHSYLDWLIIMSTNQPYVQRYISCKTKRKSRLSLYYSLFPQMFITFLSMVIGVYIYAYYETCGPVKNNEIELSDQIVPYTVVKLAQSLPGLSGLFVATIYSGTLSTISSGINSMIVIIMEDFVSLRWQVSKESTKLNQSKVIGVLMGALVLLVSYLITYMKGTIIEISSIMMGSCGSATIGIFALGIFVPWANSIGTIIGATCGFVFTTWLSVGALFHESTSQELYVSTENCPSGNITTLLQQNSTNVPVPSDDSLSPYDISFMYYRVMSITITLVLGIVFSFITGAKDPKEADPKLFMPLVRGKFLPEKFVKFWRFGVPENNSKEKEEMILLAQTPS